MLSFNPFLDASHVIVGEDQEEEIIFQSLFGCFITNGMKYRPIVITTFNPFLDASINDLEFLKEQINKFFQSLFGCFVFMEVFDGSSATYFQSLFGCFLNGSTEFLGLI